MIGHVPADRKASAAPGRPDLGRFGRTGVRAEAIRILEDIRSELERDPGGARVAALQLATLLAVPTTVAPAGARGGLAPWQQRKIERFLRERLSRPPRVSEVAQQISLSIGHFSRAFRATFGASPHAYIIRLRMERAQTLMLASEEPLAEIALACGFADQAHFSTIFRREIGETPSAWRRRHLADPHTRQGAA